MTSPIPSGFAPFPKSAPSTTESGASSACGNFPTGLKPFVLRTITLENVHG